VEPLRGSGWEKEADRDGRGDWVGGVYGIRSTVGRWNPGGGYLGSIFTGQRGIRRMDMCGGAAKVQSAESISVKGSKQDRSIEKKK